jgi:hypothetical protein
MQKITEFLETESCPHCGKPKPSLQWPRRNQQQDCFSTSGHEGNRRWWGVYFCRSCGGVIIASAPANPQSPSDPCSYIITEIFPIIQKIDESIPAKPHEFLRQAQGSIHTPAGSIMLSASAVDAMLKDKGYTDGSLYDRIDKAAEDHLITDSMAQWAHQIRLDANEQRHADKDVGLPTQTDAKLTFDFAMAFAEYLFVLPSKVTRGIADTQPPETAS